MQKLKKFTKTTSEILTDQKKWESQKTENHPLW